MALNDALWCSREHNIFGDQFMPLVGFCSWRTLCTPLFYCTERVIQFNAIEAKLELYKMKMMKFCQRLFAHYKLIKKEDMREK